jgi:creatinine amidohydrolase
MQWEYLTSDDFAQAVKSCGVCVLALGVLERHSDHLPLGTDFLNGHKLACLAAEKEPAVVFPPFYFGQIYEARCFPGAVTLAPALLLNLLQGVLDEIGRNGFKKILLYNAHGGNIHFLRFLAQASLWEEKPYQLYLYTGQLSPGRQKAWESLLETESHGHACECETSLSLANHPELVRMERVPSTPGEALGRLGHLPQNYSGIWWYADYPQHYAGDARPASREKGLALRALQVDDLADFIAAVKADQAVPLLSKEFFDRTNSFFNV